MGFEPRSMYGLYQYALIFNLSSERSSIESIYAFAQTKLNTACTASNTTITPWRVNECIAHFQGFINLQDLLGLTRNQTVVNNLNLALNQRVTSFNKDWPNSPQSADRKYNVSRNFMFMIPELGSYWRTNALNTLNAAIREYEYLDPLWFVGGNDNTLQESTMQPLDDLWLFQAKAHVQNLSAAELYPYLDAPAFYRGDLFYIHNLTTVIAKMDTVNPPPPSPTDPDGDGDYDFMDYLRLVFKMNQTDCSINRQGTCTIDIFDINHLLTFWR
jgi:hypothetical protein